MGMSNQKPEVGICSCVMSASSLGRLVKLLPQCLGGNNAFDEGLNKSSYCYSTKAKFGNLRNVGLMPRLIS